MGKKEDISRRDLLKTGGAVAVAAAATGILPGTASAAKEALPRWAPRTDLETTKKAKPLLVKGIGMI